MENIVKTYNEFINESYGGITGIFFKREWAYEGVMLRIKLDDNESMHIEFGSGWNDNDDDGYIKLSKKLGKFLKKHKFDASTTETKRTCKLIMKGVYDLMWSQTPNSRTKGKYHLTQYNADRSHNFTIEPFGEYYLEPLSNNTLERLYDGDRAN